MAKLTPEQRSMQARIAALTRWSREDDRAGATAAARDGLEARFVREVDPDGVLPPAELAKRVEMARKAHMLKMALASSQKRRRP